MVPSDRESVMAIEKELDYMRSDMDQDSGMTVARYMSKKSAVPYGSKELMMSVASPGPSRGPPLAMSMIVSPCTVHRRSRLPRCAPPSSFLLPCPSATCTLVSAVAHSPLNSRLLSRGVCQVHCGH